MIKKSLKFIQAASGFLRQMYDYFTLAILPLLTKNLGCFWLYAAPKSARTVFYLSFAAFLLRPAMHSRDTRLYLTIALLLSTACMNLCFTKIYWPFSWFYSVKNPTEGSGSWWMGCGNGSWFAFYGRNGINETKIIPGIFLDDLYVKK